MLIFDMFDNKDNDRMVRYTEQQLSEVAMSTSALRKWANTADAKKVMVGFEFEMYFPNTQHEDDEYEENDYDYDDRIEDIDSIVTFFSDGNRPTSISRLNRIAEELRTEYQDQANEFALENSSLKDFKDWLHGRRDVNSELISLARENLGPKADSDEIEEEASDMFDDWAEEQWDKGDNKYYERYMEQVNDDAFYNFSENTFLRNRGLYRYSDVESEYNLEWPYYNEPTSANAHNLDYWANEIEQVVGMPVISGSYHSVRRDDDRWILESDSSLDEPKNNNDRGLELISPPLPLAEAVKQLNNVVDWAKNNGLYTNRSTGLHMNMSVSGTENVDWIKLVLFLGDKYVLKVFDRATSAYATSSLGKLERKIKKVNETAAEPDSPVYYASIDINKVMQVMRAGTIELARQSLQSGLGADNRYQSVHIKSSGSGSYIEFRGPGGDWLSKAGDTEKTVLDTVYRLGRAMTIAADPGADRREYASKLYKLITPRDPDQREVAQLFAKYSAGEISGEQLKRQWAEIVLQAERDAAARSRDREASYKIVDRNTGEVLDRYEAGSDSEALEYAMNHWAGRGINYDIKREVNREKEFTAKERRRQDLARRVAGLPTWWRVSVKDRPRYTGWIQAPTAVRAIQDFERRMNIEGIFDRAKFEIRTEEPPPLRDQPMPDAVKNLRVQPRNLLQTSSNSFPRKPNWALVTADGKVDERFFAPNREAAMDRLRSWQNEPDRPDTPRWVVPIEQEAPAQPQSQPITATSINQPDEGESDWQVVWSEYRDRNGREELVHDSLRVVAASARAASSRIISSLIDQGRRPFNVSATPTDPPPWRRNRQISSSQGEFTGRWLFKNANTGDVLHTISGIGNSQADANRYAREWAQREGVGHIPLEVVPEMQ